MPGHLRQPAVRGTERVRQSPVYLNAVYRLRTNIEEGLASCLVEASGINPGTEQIMEGQSWSQPDIMTTALGGVLPVCGALPASPLTAWAQCSEGGRAGTERISILAQGSAGPDSKPDPSRSSTGGQYSLGPCGRSDLGPIS